MNLYLKFCPMARFLLLLLGAASLLALGPNMARADWQWDNDVAAAEKQTTAKPVAKEAGDSANSELPIYEVKFEFENTGKDNSESITVTGVTFACSCITHYDFTSTTAKPGEKGTLTIRMTVDHSVRNSEKDQGRDVEFIATSRSKETKAKELTVRFEK